MEYHWIVPLVASVANVVLAVVVNRHGRERHVSEVFTFLAVALVFWNLIYVVFYSVDNVALAAPLGSFFRAGALYLFPAVFHLCCALPGRARSRALQAVVIGDYLLAVGFVAANATGRLVTGLQSVGWGYYSIGTALYDIFSIYVILNFVGAFVVLVHELRTSTQPRVRLQLKFWLLALAVSLPLGLTNLLPVYGFEIYPIGNLGSAAWAGVVAYAIVRHRLMDIELAVTKGVAYIAASVVSIGPAVAVVVLMQRFELGRVDPDITAVIVVLFVAIGVLFPRLRDWVEGRLQGALFPEKREARIKLADFAKSLIRILDKEKLTVELCNTIDEGLDLEATCVFVGDPAGRNLTCWQHLGPPPTDDRLPVDHAFSRFLVRSGESVLAEESLSAGRDSLVVHDIFARNAWHVCVPLIAGEVVLGFVGLGKKKSLDAFSVADLDALTGVAAQASVALENARLYEELRKSEEIINRADRLSALGTLAAGIAHEIRNPLVSIQTFFQLAPSRLGDEEFMNSFLKLAEGEVSRIRDLVGELLSYAKSTSPTIRAVDVGELVTRVSTLLEPHARNRKVQLERDIEASDCSVEADSDQLTQVMINIVLNAIQAAPEGGRVRVSANRAEGEELGLCHVRVEDNGPGVPAELRDSIFNPFFTTKDAGTGLGLAIAHRIVNDYGGFLRVDDTFEAGGAFDVYLPLTSELEQSSERVAI